MIISNQWVGASQEEELEYLHMPKRSAAIGSAVFSPSVVEPTLFQLLYQHPYATLMDGHKERDTPAIVRPAVYPRPFS
jgi:hypothetical protein